MNGVIDISDSNMPVISDDTKDILFTYLNLYGKADNRHVVYCTADNYKFFEKRAKEFVGFSEIKGIVQRIEKARINLEKSVLALDLEVVIDLGFELKEDEGKLLVYKNDLE